MGPVRNATGNDRCDRTTDGSPADLQTGNGRRTDAELIAAYRDSPDDFALVFDRHAVARVRTIN
ncbi:hypothetical protein [Kribbella steppae]|uniref:hypothetical protein n=1 Tax=Kribbella steppae TaxID=2512223 RepID=UPI0010532B80|nr:hypothetical protein [Kribbella steppae]